MAEHHKALADQLKQAEIDKLKVEKEKLEFDLAQSKIPPKTNYKEWIIMIATLGSLLFLYIEYGFKPTLEVETRRAELANIIVEKALFKMQGHLDTVSRFLKAESLELDKREKKIDSLSTINSVQKATNTNLIQQKNKLTSDKQKIEGQIMILSNTVQNLNSEKQELQPFVDSLQSIANIEQRKRWTNIVDITVIYQTEAGATYGAATSSPIVTTYAKQKLKFYPWHTNGIGQQYYYLFPGDNCEIVVKGMFKLKNGVYRFKVPEKDSTIIVPIEKR